MPHACRLILLVFALAATPAAAADFDVQARQAFLIDLTTNSVLLEKNADMRMPPASMSKLMTAYLVFERLKNGSIALEDEFPISRKAHRKGGSKMFLSEGATAKLGDLIRGSLDHLGVVFLFSSHHAANLLHGTANGLHQFHTL